VTTVTKLDQDDTNTNNNDNNMMATAMGQE